MGEIFAAYCLKNIGDNLHPRRMNYFKLQQINIIIFTTSVGRILSNIRVSSIYRIGAWIDRFQVRNRLKHLILR
jgi:hypothetical protein